MASFNQNQPFSQYDFPTLTNQCRVTQLLCLCLEVLLVHSESSTLSGITFVFYSLLVLVTLLQVAARWYYNIDGRYDLRQLMQEPEMQFKGAYAMALFAPAIIGLLCLKLINLQEGLAGSLFFYAALLQVSAAVVLNVLEAYEVFVKAN